MTKKTAKRPKKAVKPTVRFWAERMVERGLPPWGFPHELGQDESQLGHLFRWLADLLGGWRNTDLPAIAGFKAHRFKNEIMKVNGPSAKAVLHLYSWFRSEFGEEIALEELRQLICTVTTDKPNQTAPWRIVAKRIRSRLIEAENLEEV